MPAISDKLRTGRKFDRRLKLTDAQRAAIRENAEGKSMRALAIEFGVSRRTIQFILQPDKLRENKLRRDERGGWRQYYKKDEWCETHREHRKYKRKLLEEDKITRM